MHHANFCDCLKRSWACGGLSVQQYSSTTLMGDWELRDVQEHAMADQQSGGHSVLGEFSGRRSPRAYPLMHSNEIRPEKCHLRTLPSKGVDRHLFLSSNNIVCPNHGVEGSPVFASESDMSLHQEFSWITWACKRCVCM
jgi:hypothetical protein